MSEGKDGGRRSPHLDVSEDKMYDSRLVGNYDLHDIAHSPAHGRRGTKVRTVECVEYTQGVDKGICVKTYVR